ncbi:hypothetical protein NXV81_29725 [Bacteroides ovatus]|nr:hypothetical protein [Bacteroides ovatus]
MLDWSDFVTNVRSVRRNKFADTAKRLYDTYIITRKWTDDKGTGLPWNNENNSNGRSRNICTNAPGALMAAKLYKKYNEDKYLSDAKIFHNLPTTIIT